MKAIRDMSPEELAAFVCDRLAGAGIRVTLTGGACVAIWSDGAYESHDLDFIEEGLVNRREIRRVLRAEGFTERNRYFSHPDTASLIEFPSGPLAVGNEPVKQVAERRLATGVLRLLSPTDCVKDRLAAWFHWKDRQALDQAILVARAQAVNRSELRRWAEAEGESAAFTVFTRGLSDT
jgi:hypothetical protein